ncbi:MAG: tRNA (guanosine(37)-N1)-methyltransferase TrmD [Elusimicrobiota bacterium]
MRIDIVTLFPEAVKALLEYSIAGRACKKGLVKFGYLNPRDFARDKHKTVDDRPYGGGKGMLLMAEPFYKAIKKLKRKNSKVILLSPRGKVFNQEKAKELSLLKHLILVCAHYEGIDERISGYIDEEISLGDFILTGGEPAAVCLADAAVRLVPEVINKDSLKNESFNDGLLEAPQYTRPAVWKRKKVPQILLSGNHAEIEKWRKEKSLLLTAERRPDLLEKFKRRKL